VGVKDGLPDIEWCDIPAGEYRYQDGKVTLAAYRIAKYPITFMQFQAFLDAVDGFKSDAWWDGMPEEAEAYGRTYRVREMAEQRFPYTNHPREMVSWYQAVAFCRWLSAKLGYEVRLPTEQEWEVAARYPDGREYPWGDDFSAAKCNVSESEIGRTTPVGMYADGANPTTGICDLAGNVWEWCVNKYRNPEVTGVDASDDARVLRGGSFDDLRDSARASSRDGSDPDYRDDGSGFRVVCRP
jgi:formylglycine-generating enzyme required for sulfatase activity